jgi:hypothetical protein
MLYFVSLLTKEIKMKTRFRVEIYDANKSNDVTIYSEQGVDKEYLTELVYSNLRNFDGAVKAYVFDNLKKKKITAVYVPVEIINSFKSKLPAKINLELI